MSFTRMKEQLNDMPLWKKILWLLLFAGAPIISLILTIWLFTLQGTVGLFIWFPIFTYALLLIIVSAILGPLIILLTMKSHHKLRIVGWVFCFISLMVSSIFLVYVGGTLATPRHSTDPQLLMVDGTGENGVPDMAVTYWTFEATQDSIKWGKGALSEEIEEETTKKSHVFVLEDLDPDSEYWYQINGEGKTYKFNTPLVNGTLRFAVSSDPHFGREESANDVTIEILDQITDTANNIDLFFMLGDFVEYGFINDEWEEGLNAISPYTSIMPTRPIIGNHDTIFAGTQHYTQSFYPEGMPVDTGSQLWYHIEVGDIHFFMMDLEWGLETYTAEQRAWFEEEITEVDKDDWTIVMSHSFYYSSGVIAGGKSWGDQDDMIATFVDIFEENDVDMVFSGHNHHAEILEQNGIYYQIAGAFGGLPDPERELESDKSQWYMNIENDDEFGFFEVDITGDNATLTFRNRDYDNLQQITIDK